MKKVVLAEKYGFCFGVKRAVKITEETGEKAGLGNVFVWKEIVHNDHVVSDLRKRGMESVQTLEEIPRGKTVIFSAHGVTPEMWIKAQELGLEIVDATCPLVARVHQLAKEASQKGNTVIYIGDEGHDEQQGVKGEVKTEFITIKTLDDINKLEIKDPTKITVLTQTTLSVDDADAVIADLKVKFPKAEIHENICQATTERQAAVKDLTSQVQLIIVVGSPKSSNSKRLAEVAKNSGATVIMIDNVDELDSKSLEGFEKIGITAGASTPENILDEVIKKIKEI